jgi:hypothetical protein
MRNRIRHILKEESSNQEFYQFTEKEISSLEIVLNKMMKKKYDWWKKIQINDISIRTNWKICRISALLTVDEDWGGNQWVEYHPHMEFPGNLGLENNEEYEIVSLGDIVGSVYGNEIRDDLHFYISSMSGQEISPEISFRTIMIEFE